MRKVPLTRLSHAASDLPMVATLVVLVSGAQAPAFGQVTPKSADPGDGSLQPLHSTAPGWRVELKRQNTERGTVDESTRTIFRTEVALDGTLSRLGLLVPFPDEKDDFGGDPFQPRLGDIKTRVGFNSFQVKDSLLGINLDFTFPTADARVKGSHKYQVHTTLRSVASGADAVVAYGAQQFRFEWEVQQSISVAGDEAYKNINNTKPVLSMRDTIATEYWVKLSFKPTIDWIESGKTGAILELETGRFTSGGWRFMLLGGKLLWGSGVPGTYGHRLQCGVGRFF